MVNLSVTHQCTFNGPIKNIYHHRLVNSTYRKFSSASSKLSAFGPNRDGILGLVHISISALGKIIKYLVYLHI